MDVWNHLISTHGADTDQGFCACTDHKEPDERLTRVYLDTARKLHLAPALATAVRAAFARAEGRPVVGVHIRQGDYQLVSDEHYSIEGREWPAVPVWWYEQQMARIRARQPDVCFFLACTGDRRCFVKCTKK